MSTTDIHSCSYCCTRPACVAAQRDELRDRLEVAERERDAMTALLRDARQGIALAYEVFDCQQGDERLDEITQRIDDALAAMGGELPEPAPSAEPSVDMVQAACEAHLLEWAARVLDGYVYSADDVNDDARACMRAALRAALGVR